MAVIKSREKQIRKTAKARASNSVVRKKLKTSLKKFHNAIDENNKEEALTLLNTTISLLDRSITKNAHNKNYVSRQKSSLTKAYNALSA